jgi:hypothetical protein
MILREADAAILAATAFVRFGLRAIQHDLVHRELVGLYILPYREIATRISVCHFEFEGVVRL